MSFGMPDYFIYFTESYDIFYANNDAFYLSFQKIAALAPGLARCPNLIIMFDFEDAECNAALDVWKNGTRKGCNFHYKQGMWRQTMVKGLSTHYTSKLRCKNINSLILIIKQTYILYILYSFIFTFFFRWCVD